MNVYPHRNLNQIFSPHHNHWGEHYTITRGKHYSPGEHILIWHQLLIKAVGLKQGWINLGACYNFLLTKKHNVHFNLLNWTILLFYFQHFVVLDYSSTVLLSDSVTVSQLPSQPENFVAFMWFCRISPLSVDVVPTTLLNYSTTVHIFMP